MLYSRVPVADECDVEKAEEIRVSAFEQSRLVTTAMTIRSSDTFGDVYFHVAQEGTMLVAMGATANQKSGCD